VQNKAFKNKYTMLSTQHEFLVAGLLEKCKKSDQLTDGDIHKIRPPSASK